MSGEEQKNTSGSGRLAPEDYYMDSGLMVFTESFHLKRGTCCGSGCRHCPYEKLDTQSKG